MSTAAAALIGVALGGLVTGGVQLGVALLLDRRRLKRERRIAARLLVEEFDTLDTKVSSLIDEPRQIAAVDIKRHEQLLTLWAEYRVTLAAELSQEDWEVVSWAIVEAGYLLHQGAVWGPTQLEPFRSSLEAAMGTLGKHR